MAFCLVTSNGDLGPVYNVIASCSRFKGSNITTIMTSTLGLTAASIACLDRDIVVAVPTGFRLPISILILRLASVAAAVHALAIVATVAVTLRISAAKPTTPPSKTTPSSSPSHYIVVEREHLCVDICACACAFVRSFVPSCVRECVGCVGCVECVGRRRQTDSKMEQSFFIVLGTQGQSLALRGSLRHHSTANAWRQLSDGARRYLT